MAKVAITNDVLDYNVVKSLTFTAGSTDGIKFDFSAADYKMVLLFQNTGTAAATVTIKKGNGIQGVTDSEAFSIAAGAIAGVRIDTGLFENVSGDEKGTVTVVPSAATVKACAVQLP